MSIEALLQKNKPNISPSSVKTYTNLLRSLYNKEHGKNSAVNLEWFDNASVVDIVKQIKSEQTRHSTLCALVAIMPDNKTYKNMILESAKIRKSEASKQEMSDREKTNWKTYDEIKAIYNREHTFIKPILAHKGEISQADFMKLQDFVILSLCSGVWIPPRRSSDWINMKLSKIDKSKDNYIEKNRFYFNEYKTKKTYGRQDVAIPPGLRKILDAYIKHNPYEYLLCDHTGGKISNVKLGQRLNHIFGNKISTSLLRHIYLTDKYKDVPSLNNMEQTAAEMGHSVIEALQYVKKA
jgi:hypothetical protein